MSSFRGEVELLSGVEAKLRGMAGEQKVLANGLESPVESCKELESRFRKDLLLRRAGDFPKNFDTFGHRGEAEVAVVGKTFERANSSIRAR